MLSALLRESRPKQWLKNVLVFAAPGAAGVLDEGDNLLLTLIAFASFCFAASGIYIWNDLLDVEADRRHPTKRNRPIASGELSIAVARAAGVLFPVVALALAAATGRWQTVAVVATYIVITIAYTLHLKHVPVVDVVTVAAGFVLRAAAGAWRSTCRCLVRSRCRASLRVAVHRGRQAVRRARTNSDRQPDTGDAGGVLDRLSAVLLSVSVAGVLISYSCGPSRPAPPRRATGRCTSCRSCRR